MENYRKSTLILGLILCVSLGLFALMGSSLPTGQSREYLPKGFQAIADVSEATALTVPAGSRVALIQAEDASVRWRDDGTNPANGTGMLLVAGDSIWYDGHLGGIKFIEEANGVTAGLNVSYYGW